jgi:hypothetical protein
MTKEPIVKAQAPFSATAIITGCATVTSPKRDILIIEYNANSLRDQ